MCSRRVTRSERRCSRSVTMSERRCSRSAGGVEGCVQEALEEWKEVFNKRYKE